MKKIVPLLLCLALALCACAGQNGPAPGPASSSPVSPLPMPERDPAVPPVSLEPVTPAPADNARYFFVTGSFLGSWEDGEWRSAADGGFTLGQLFNRDYVDVFGEHPGAVRFFAADGPGAFDDPSEAQRLLEPFGVLEGGEFIMKLPGALIGDAAALAVPDYGFYAMFDGQSYYFITNALLTIPPVSRVEHEPDEEEAARLLRAAQVDFDPARVSWTTFQCDMDSDGEEERLDLLQNPVDESGYLAMEEGDPIFYALLCSDGGETSPVAVRSIEYTDDVTAHFSAGDPIVADLDGDGMCEVVLQDRGWEWGHYAAYSLADGRWSQVLQGDYGT